MPSEIKSTLKLLSLDGGGIREPYKEDYDRDIVKIKGGFYNHIVVGELDIKALREFLSDNISPSKEFKPVPTGFENRRTN